MASTDRKIKAVLFDFMGTCLDWHSSAVAGLPSAIPTDVRSQLALDWRHAYFDYNAARLASGKEPEDFDVTLRKVLDSLLDERYTHLRSYFEDDEGEAKKRAVAVWHDMKAWPDVPPAIEKLRKEGYEVYVHANGNTRLQVDLCRSAGLQFDMLFSGELLGVLKPDPESFHKALRLLRLEPKQCVMVAAHAWDTRGGKAVGMKTVYIHRWTDDVNEDMDGVRFDHDAFLEDMRILPDVVAQFE